jgi:hypothetical protein
VNGGANKDGPDLSWKDWVTVPRQGAVQARRETRALCFELRSGRTLKYASGMTSTRFRSAAHLPPVVCTHGRRGENAP